MKNNLALIGLVGLTMFTATAFSSALSKNEKQQPKKQRHIRIVKEVDGKKAELDTVIAGDDQFVWQGDTIGGKDWAQKRPFRQGMMGQGMMGQGMRQGMGQGMRQGMGQGMMRPERFMGGRDSIESNMFMFRREMDGGRAPMSGRMDVGGMRGRIPGGFTDQMRNRNFNGRQFGGGAPQRQFTMNGPRRATFPQGQNMRMQRSPERGNMINLSDLNVISYKTKKMSGNREKIEIIRKKSAGKGRPSFNNLSGVDHLISPMPPRYGRRGQANHERRGMMNRKSEKIEKEVPNEQNK